MTLPPWRVLVTSLVVVFGGSFHLGYQEIVVNPTYDIFRVLLNESFFLHYDVQLSNSAIDWIWSFTTTAITLGQMIGCILVIPLSRRVGRVRGIALTNLILILCTPLFVLSKNNLFELFAIGRFIAGIAIGMVMALQALFLQEIGSVEYAGTINTLTGLLSEVGATAAAIAGTRDVLGTEENFQSLFYILLPLLALSFVYMLGYAHETPFYLVNSGEEEKALKSIKFYHSHKSEEDQMEVLDDAKRALKLYSKQLSVASILRLAPARNALLLSVAMNFAITFTGILAVSYFGTELIEKSGVDHDLASWLNIGILSMSMWTLLLLTCVVDRIPRRTMCIGGCLSIAATNAAVIILLVPYADTNSVWVGVVFSVILGVFAILYGATLGNVTFFIALELSAPNYANVVSSIALSSQFVMASAVPFIFYPLNAAVGAYSFLLFVVPLLLFAIYFWIALPETLHRPLSGILMDLGASKEDVKVLKCITDHTAKPTDKIMILTFFVLSAFQLPIDRLRKRERFPKQRQKEIL